VISTLAVKGLHKKQELYHRVTKDTKKLFVVTNAKGAHSENFVYSVPRHGVLRVW